MHLISMLWDKTDYDARLIIDAVDLTKFEDDIQVTSLFKLIFSRHSSLFTEISLAITASIRKGVGNTKLAIRRSYLNLERQLTPV